MSRSDFAMCITPIPMPAEVATTPMAKPHWLRIACSGEKAVLRLEGIVANVDASGWVCLDVLDPVTLGAPCRADDDFKGLGPITQHHERALMQLPALSADAGQKEERVSQEPALAVMVCLEGHPNSSSASRPGR
jgi:hypothetical protein